MSYVVDRPLFLFNATALETDLPFAFSQRIIHLPIKNPVLSKTARLDLVIQSTDETQERQERRFRLRQPLGRVTTLEELNSSPAATPLAFAAMASAAFPIGFEPLRLKKYGYDPIQRKIYESSEELRVSDGSLYDNSGLFTLVELFESIVKVTTKLRTLILLSINADADEYDSFYANKIPGQEGFMQANPLSLNFPIRYKAIGYDSLNLIHYANKRRAEEMAISKIQEIVCGRAKQREEPKETVGCKNAEVRFLYFPVNLAQLSPLDKYCIPDPSNLYERLRKIPTNFVINDEDDVLLGQAAELIMTAKQDNGWNKKMKKGESASQPRGSIAHDTKKDASQPRATSKTHQTVANVACRRLS